MARDLEYEKAIHALQSGVEMEAEFNHKLYDPKHLRVGVDTAHVSQDGLASLLIAKKVISKEEYVEAIRAAANREVARAEASLSFLLKKKITLY